MDFKKDANVFTADGEKVGKIVRVVLTPEDREVTHLVIQQGFLFTKDKLLPVGLIGEATEEQVTLSVESEELELPDFRITRSVPIQGTGGTGWTGVGTPGGTGAARTASVEEKRVPEGTVALKKGAMVFSSDEKRMGRVETVLTDPEEHRATHLVIARGLLLTERKRIPTSWISRVMEDEVYLEVTAETLQDLPEYEPTS